MAWIREVPLKSGTKFKVKWMEPGRSERTRSFDDRDSAVAFKAQIEETWPAGLPRIAFADATSPEALRERIRRSSRVDANGCWLWQLNLNNAGYGVLTVRVVGARPRSMSAHRVSYEHFVGPIPDGLHLDHLCRVRSCCNPAHLEPVTCRENALRSPITQAAIHAAKTHCVNGHPFDEANTAIATGSNGRPYRACRACRNANSKRSRAKSRAAALLEAYR